MNFSHLWDWAFFWSVFENFLSSVMPMSTIYIAISAVSLLLGSVIFILVRAGRN